MRGACSVFPHAIRNTQHVSHITVHVSRITHHVSRFAFHGCPKLPSNTALTYKEKGNMRTDSFKGKDFITLLEWSKEEVETILEVATDLKRRRSEEHTSEL